MLVKGATARKSSNVHFSMWDVITYPFQNFNGAEPLKFENGWVISSHALLGMWLLIRVGIEINQC